LELEPVDETIADRELLAELELMLSVTEAK
jgi:hypothetical protein